MSILLLFIFSCQGKDDAKVRYLTVATGSPTAVYYTAGIAVAELVNQNTSSHNIDLKVESTAGSVSNILALQDKKANFAFAQADQEYKAYHGIGSWENNPQRELRFICSFHREIVTLVASDESGIYSLDDLRGKRINIGPLGSGHRENALDVLGQKGLDPNNDFQTYSFNTTEASQKLQSGEIDAFFCTVGHPNGTLLEATNGHKSVHFVPLLKMRALIKDSPYYSKSLIPFQFYPRATNTEDVISISTQSSFLTSSFTDENDVYEVTKTIFENMPILRAKHPSFMELNTKDMLEGRLCPVHPGALRYFKEASLLR